MNILILEKETRTKKKIIHRVLQNLQKKFFIHFSIILEMKQNNNTRNLRNTRKYEILSKYIISLKYPLVIWNKIV